jgi:anti-sigma-K factor RskA
VELVSRYGSGLFNRCACAPQLAVQPALNVELSEGQKILIGKPIKLAVSLEPKDGSPTVQPPGPVVYQGP